MGRSSTTTTQKPTHWLADLPVHPRARRQKHRGRGAAKRALQILPPFSSGSTFSAALWGESSTSLKTTLRSPSSTSSTFCSTCRSASAAPRVPVHPAPSNTSILPPSSRVDFPPSSVAMMHHLRFSRARSTSHTHLHQSEDRLVRSECGRSRHNSNRFLQPLSQSLCSASGAVSRSP